MRVSTHPDELLSALSIRFPWLSVRIATRSADAEVRLTFATHDSRSVEPGALFCCIRGGAFDGHRFAAEAIGRGAKALLVDHVIPGVDVVQFVVENTRDAMGPVSAALFGFPSDHLLMIGVTGTNGKTTTSHILGEILSKQGLNCRVIGTLTQKRTTPEATELQEQLADFVADGVTHVVMEVTSHALDLHRVDGIVYDTAIFTNLSQDHLDYHETMESYFRAKAKLFETGVARRAVVNTDDPHGRLLLTAHLIPTVTYSLIDAEDLDMRADGTSFRWRGAQFQLPMAGSFNVMNALGAATAAAGLGIDPDEIAVAARGVSVPGRYEPITLGQPFAVVVDFAHTPDGLERVLKAARSTLSKGCRLLVVFGCGGDRDRTKRPLMGEIASSLADEVYVTSDNPRTEDSGSIIRDILGGIVEGPDVHVEPDRRRAIGLALAAARPGDVVMIAGKGHESGQTVGSVTLPFDDRVVASELILDLELRG